MDNGLILSSLCRVGSQEPLRWQAMGPREPSVPSGARRDTLAGVQRGGYTPAIESPLRLHGDRALAGDLKGETMTSSGIHVH